MHHPGFGLGLLEPTNRTCHAATTKSSLIRRLIRAYMSNLVSKALGVGGVHYCIETLHRRQHNILDTTVIKPREMQLGYTKERLSRRLSPQAKNTGVVPDRLQ
jgi:hypothetical protein